MSQPLGSTPPSSSSPTTVRPPLQAGVDQGEGIDAPSTLVRMERIAPDPDMVPIGLKAPPLCQSEGTLANLREALRKGGVQFCTESAGRLMAIPFEEGFAALAGGLAGSAMVFLFGGAGVGYASYRALDYCRELAGVRPVWSMLGSMIGLAPSLMAGYREHSREAFVRLVVACLGRLVSSGTREGLNVVIEARKPSGQLVYLMEGDRPQPSERASFAWASLPNWGVSMAGLYLESLVPGGALGQKIARAGISGGTEGCYAAFQEAGKRAAAWWSGGTVGYGPGQPFESKEGMQQSFLDNFNPRYGLGLLANECTDEALKFAGPSTLLQHAVSGAARMLAEYRGLFVHYLRSERTTRAEEDVRAGQEQEAMLAALGRRSTLAAETRIDVTAPRPLLHLKVHPPSLRVHGLEEDGPP